MSDLTRLLYLIQTGMPLEISSGIFDWVPSMCNINGDGFIKAYNKPLAALYDGTMLEVDLNIAEIIRLDTQEVRKLFTDTFGDSRKLIFIQQNSDRGFLAYERLKGFFFTQFESNSIVHLETGSPFILHKANADACISLCTQKIISSGNFVKPGTFCLKQCDTCGLLYLLEYESLRRYISSSSFICAKCTKHIPH